MISATVTVSSTPAKLAGTTGAPIPGGERVLIKNTHATDKLIIGGPNVAANNGFGIDAGQTLDLGGIGVGMAGAGTGVWAIRGGTNDIITQVLALP
jgi:hypothetical protein